MSDKIKSRLQMQIEAEMKFQSDKVIEPSIPYYVALVQGQVIQRGDECEVIPDGWMPVSEMSIGSRYKSEGWDAHKPMRRTVGSADTSI